MARNQDNTTLIVVLIVLLVLVGFLGFGMMGFGGMMGRYGNTWMCSHMGGIWCYWPSFGWVTQVLVVIALVLFIIWIVRQLKQNGNEGRQESFIRTPQLRHSRGRK